MAMAPLRFVVVVAAVFGSDFVSGIVKDFY